MRPALRARARRRRVLIAGAGVAALEAVLGLRALAGDRVAVTLLAPDAKFVNRAMAIDRPSAIGSVGALKVQDIADEFDVDRQRGSLAHVDAERHVVVTDRGHELEYDQLVLAVGARAERPWRTEGVMTYRDGRDAGDYRRLLHLLEAGRVGQLAFVEPQGSTWPLPLYELALTAANHGKALGVDVQVRVVTPARAPLSIFGTDASAAVTAALHDAGVRVHTDTRATPSRPGRLWLTPGMRRIAVDRVVTVPRLAGPRPSGVPSDADGFIPVDRYGRVLGLTDVFAAGDATAFPVKQGGLAAQQADVVAKLIAASVGADVVPRPFRPMLRGLLRLDGAPLYMRTPLVTGPGRATVSRAPLWWPPNRLGGCYLAPYLSRFGHGAVMHTSASPRSSPSVHGLHQVVELADLRLT